MNARIFIFILCLAAQANFAQGVFLGSNVGARTRLGSMDGPLAGSDIYGLFLAGSNSLSLIPVGAPQAHINGGTYGSRTVPGIPQFTSAFVQLWAWDATVWGSDFEDVPLNQIGRTDIVTVFLTDGIDFTVAPVFTQPAIVPIPEPSACLLAMLGAGALSVRRFIGRHRRKQFQQRFGQELNSFAR